MEANYNIFFIRRVYWECVHCRKRVPQRPRFRIISSLKSENTVGWKATLDWAVVSKDSMLAEFLNEEEE